MYMMPSKEELCASQGSAATPSLAAIDVEQLVSELKENLRLSTASNTLKVRTTYHKTSRPSPYRVPCRSLSEPACEYCTYKTSRYATCCAGCPRGRNQMTNQQSDDDPYEMLQSLIKSQNLIKEAVRRLQFNLTKPLDLSHIYDSSDEEAPRSPPPQPLYGIELV